MKRKLQVIVALLVAVMTISCNKDNLYIVDGNDKITSIIIVSDDYSAGIPAIQMNDTYSYSYSASGQFSSNYSIGVSDINIKLNPSDTSLEDVAMWKVVRRSAATKALDNEEIFSGDIAVVRSETAPELVTLKIDDSQDEFFDASGDYVYSVVAVYDDGQREADFSGVERNICCPRRYVKRRGSKPSRSEHRG